ncbi:hypothetical protein H311_04284, partial [Anncaliia algerae PRA109]
VDKKRKIHIQFVELSNSQLKIEIKKRRGIKTYKRSDFLKEFYFFYNNRDNLYHSILNLLKVWPSFFCFINHLLLIL